MVHDKKGVLMICKHAYVLHGMAPLSVDKVSRQLCPSLFVPIN